MSRLYACGKAAAGSCSTCSQGTLQFLTAFYLDPEGLPTTAPHTLSLSGPTLSSSSPRGAFPSPDSIGPPSHFWEVFYLFQLIQVLQPRQDDLLAGLLDLAGEEDLVEDGVDLVEVEDEVELAHVAEEGVEHLDEEVDRLEERQLVVVGVDARAEEEPRVPPVHDLVVPELDKVGLVLLVPRRDEPVDLFVGRLRSAGRAAFAGEEGRERRRM